MQVRESSTQGCADAAPTVRALSGDATVLRLLDVFHRLGPELASSRGLEDALPMITGYAVRSIDGAEVAAITQVNSDRFDTLAATGDLATRVDAIQYELGSGPCIDAALEDRIYRTGDLRSDPRWPRFGERAAVETGVNSMMSFRMFFEDDDLVAALNLYSTGTDAFSDDDRLTGVAISTHGALALTSARRFDRIDNLERALATNRDIGVAIGVLMGVHRIPREQAFELLRMASQRSHRKLADIARDVAETGALTIA